MFTVNELQLQGMVGLFFTIIVIHSPPSCLVRLQDSIGFVTLFDYRLKLAKMLQAPVRNGSGGGASTKAVILVRLSRL